MQPLQTIRQWQIAQMRYAIPTLRLLLSSISKEDATTYRDGGDGWTVAEVMGHLRDFEEVFLQRAERTLSEDNPPLAFPDPDNLAVEAAYNSLPLEDLYAEWVLTRQRFIALLESIEGDETWERSGAHPKRGPFSLNDQLFLTIYHDLLHADQIARIMEDKLTGTS